MVKATKTLLMILGTALALVLTGCSSSEQAESDPMMDMGDDMSMEEGGESDLMINSDSDSGNAGSLVTVNFAYNSSALDEMTRASLEENANFLKENPSITVEIEGHCDERGGVQYNLALGERRANAVRDYLVAMGVPSGSLSTTSLGKERPLAFGHDESAWAQNRRANFVITGR